MDKWGKDSPAFGLEFTSKPADPVRVILEALERRDKGFSPKNILSIEELLFQMISLFFR
jgi:hypothetical protein